MIEIALVSRTVRISKRSFIRSTITYHYFAFKIEFLHVIVILPILDKLISHEKNSIDFFKHSDKYFMYIRIMAYWLHEK
jgi:hypothetical protein